MQSSPIFHFGTSGQSVGRVRVASNNGCSDATTRTTYLLDLERQRLSFVCYPSPATVFSCFCEGLPRQAGYTRASSFSSTGSTPPLLRQSSSESSSSMDSSPSPITPAYSYVDNTVLPYDPLLRQDLTGYLPSPSTITPFLEQQLMIAPNMTDPHYPGKATIIPPLTLAQYPIVPTSVHPSLPPLAVPSPATLHTPPTSAPAPSNQPTTSPTTNAAPPPKKNKYPCPYSQSHNCQATFTTSGHAARHGKKHTG